MQEPVRSLDALIDQLRWKREELVAHFYGRLFGRAPEFEELFGGVDHFDLNRKFAGALLVIVRAGRSVGSAEPRLVELARDHVRRGVLTRERLELFGDSMVQSLRHYAAHAWNDELERQWHVAFSAVMELFLSSAPASEDAGPDAHREPSRS